MSMPRAARVTVAIGAAGLALVVLNQATAPSLDPALERAAVLAGILAVVLMLVGVLWTRVEPLSAAKVDLPGHQGLRIRPDLPDPLARELAWGSTMLLTATPAATLLLLWGDQTLLRRGLLADEPPGSALFRQGEICRRVLATGKSISLVDLRLYPGRDEFEALLPDLPAVVVQPLAGDGLLLVGGWAPRCFSRADLLWIEGWSRRLTTEWAAELDEASRAAERETRAEP
jgi:hypothetical protein